MDLSRVTVVLPALDEADALPAALASFPAGTDLVVGSRALGRREPGAMSRLALLENRVLGAACGLLFGVPLFDLGPFRALRRDVLVGLGMRDRGQGWPLEMVDRKSTRLNSSHGSISYAVFCLK